MLMCLLGDVIIIVFLFEHLDYELVLKAKRWSPRTPRCTTDFLGSFAPLADRGRLPFSLVQN